MSRIARDVTALATVSLLVGIALPAGAVNAEATPQLRHAFPSSQLGSLYATDFYTPTLLAYKPDSEGDAAPDRTVTGADTAMTTVTDVAVNTSGDAYLSDDGDSILEYAANASGDSTPSTTISGAATDLNFPSALALAPNGNIWVANFDGGSLLEFAAGASGNASPIAVINGAKTGLGNTVGIAVSPDGENVWASNDLPSAGSLTEYSTGDQGNVAPLATISGTNTTFEVNMPSGLAIDSSGAVWVSHSNISPAILEFAPGTTGNAPPENVIDGISTGLADPAGISLDPLGDLFVTDKYHHDIAEWKTGNQAVGHSPDVTISGADTGLGQQDSPDGVAFYWGRLSPPSGLVATAAKTGISLKWQPPLGAPANTEVTGYTVERSPSATGRFAPIATTTHRFYLDQHVKPARTYYYRVIAYNHVTFSQLNDDEDDRSATFIAAPSAPRIVRAKPGHRSIAMSWKPPARRNGSTITGYTIKYAPCKIGRPRCKAKTTKASRTARHRRIRGLHGRRRYFVVVLARSSAGAGQPSKRATAVPKP